jgi:hypothetical protein
MLVERKKQDRKNAKALLPAKKVRPQELVILFYRIFFAVKPSTYYIINE